jgi:FAS-associated factor 2
MAESALDLGQLSSTQQEALNQYTQVTNQEITEAIPLLRRSEWNVQVWGFLFFIQFASF